MNSSYLEQLLREGWGITIGLSEWKNWDVTMAQSIAKFSEPEKTIAKAKGLSGAEAEAVDGFAKLILRWD